MSIPGSGFNGDRSAVLKGQPPTKHSSVSKDGPKKLAQLRAICGQAQRFNPLSPSSFGFQRHRSWAAPYATSTGAGVSSRLPGVRKSRKG